MRTTRILTEEEALKRIQEQITYVNRREDRDISFEGFVDGYLSKGNQTKLKLHCNIHNITWETTTYNNFMKPTFAGGCLECKKLSTIKTHLYTPEEAKKRVEKIQKGSRFGYDFSKIESTFVGVHKNVTITCPKHGDFKISYVTLTLGVDHGICPECRKEELSARKTVDIHSKEILDKIQENIKTVEKTTGTKLTFLGYDRGTGAKSAYLKLRCEEHDLVWTTTPLDNFLHSSKRYLSCWCPICSSGWTTEKYCYQSILNAGIDKGDLLIHSKLDVPEDLLVITNKRAVFVDYYIPRLNMIIEFDGQQHYDYNKYFHKECYQKFTDQVNRDNVVEEYCKLNSIKLLRIPYVDSRRIDEVIHTFIKEGKDITTKIQPKLLPAIIYDKDTTT